MSATTTVDLAGHPAPYTVGLDVGTTRVKAVTFDATGAVVAHAERPTPWRRDDAGIEMDAVELADVVRAVVGEAAATVPQVVGVGTTGMGESGVLTGADGVPLAPVRAWHDQRADVAAVRAAVGDTEFAGAVGMTLDAQPSLPKILRLRTEYPGCAAATRFYSVPEWAVAALGGTPGSELSLASRTGLLDVTTGRAWSAAVDLLGVDLLGEPRPAGVPEGRVRVGGRRVDGRVRVDGRATDGPGLPASLDGAVLAVGGHDHQTAALAAGAARDGALFDSLGTAEALLQFTTGPTSPAVVASLVEDAEGLGLRITAGLTVVRGHYCVMAGLRTGFGLERVAAALGARTREERARLAADALAVLDDPTARVAALDAVGVEPTDDGVRLVLRGDAGPAQVWAATVDRLVEASNASIARMRTAAGEHTSVLAAGGWLANEAVLAAKRRQFPGLVVTTVTEAGAAGAAYLAGVAAGVFPDATIVDGAPWAPSARPQSTLVRAATGEEDL